MLHAAACYCILFALCFVKSSNHGDLELGQNLVAGDTNNRNISNTSSARVCQTGGLGSPTE